MLTMPAARRTAAALTAAIVAVVLVTFGGPSHTSSHRVSAGVSHAGVTLKSGRVPLAVSSGHHQQAPLHLDLAATPPIAISDVRRGIAFEIPRSVVVRLGRDLITPIGRAPPGL